MAFAIALRSRNGRWKSISCVSNPNGVRKRPAVTMNHGPSYPVTNGRVGGIGESPPTGFVVPRPRIERPTACVRTELIGPAI